MEGGLAAFGDLPQVVAKDPRGAIGLTDGEGAENELVARISQVHLDPLPGEVAQGQGRLDSGDAATRDQHLLPPPTLTVACHQNDTKSAGWAGHPQEPVDRLRLCRALLD
jgi:hypothetical protein